jgi:hypothetical protein
LFGGGLFGGIAAGFLGAGLFGLLFGQGLFGATITTSMTCNSRPMIGGEARRARLIFA